MRLLTWHVGCFRRFPIASFLACLAPTTACVRTTEVQAGSAEPTGPAIYLALEAVDAPQCYFLPPAGDIRFRMEVAPDGTVKSTETSIEDFALRLMRTPDLVRTPGLGIYLGANPLLAPQALSTHLRAARWDWRIRGCIRRSSA